MFAVQGWKLPHVVAQRPEKKRKAAPVADVDSEKPKTETKRRKVNAEEPKSKKPAKDVSKYLPYGKEKKGSSGPNQVPVAKERKPRPKSPSPVPKAAVSSKAQSTRPEKKPLARLPRSERDKTPPKLLPDVPPPSFSGSLSNTATHMLTPLQQKMAAKLSGARFRWINEKLYTTTGSEALKLIADKPDMFDAYHAGFRSQVRDWPLNPIDIYHARLADFSASCVAPVVVADLGCGEAMLAQRVLQVDAQSARVKVYSYDLKAANKHITACDISALPLPNGSIDVAIFCLSLMGTDFLKFIQEAHRVLKPQVGKLWISEIKSRFSGSGGAKDFVEALEKIGFKLVDSDARNKMFVSLDFVKGKDKRKKERQEGVATSVAEESRKVGKLLKPCTYKKR